MFSTWPCASTFASGHGLWVCNKQTETQKKLNTFLKGTKTLLFSPGHLCPSATFLWSRHANDPTRGWQRSVVTSVSLTGSVLNHNHSITTRRPGARWAHHYLGHNTNITPVLFLYIYTHKGQAAGHGRLKFISGRIHYTVKGLQLGLGNCGASVWLWQDSLTAKKWLS